MIDPEKIQGGEGSTLSPHERFGQLLQAWADVLDGPMDDRRNLQRDNALTALNAECPYVGQQVWAAGNGVCMIRNTDSGELVPGYLNMESVDGIYQGIQIWPLSIRDGEPRHRIFQVILVHVEHEAQIALKREESYYVLLDPDAFVQPVNEIESCFSNDTYQLPSALKGEATDDLKARISEHSQNFYSLFKSADFLRLTSHQQLVKAEKHIDIVHAEVPIRGIDVKIEAEKAFAPMLVEGRQMIGEVALSKPVTGVCLGIGSLDMPTLAHRAIRRKQQLMHAGAGLCIAVELDDATKDANFLYVDILCIPTANQAYKLVFQPNSQ